MTETFRHPGGHAPRRAGRWLQIAAIGLALASAGWLLSPWRDGAPGAAGAAGPTARAATNLAAPGEIGAFVGGASGPLSTQGVKFGDAACAHWARLSPFASGGPDARCETAAAEDVESPEMSSAIEARLLQEAALPWTETSLSATGARVAAAYLDCQTNHSQQMSAEGCQRIRTALASQAGQLLGLFRQGSDAAGDLFVRLFGTSGMHEFPLTEVTVGGQSVPAEAMAMEVLKSMAERSAEAHLRYVQLR